MATYVLIPGGGGNARDWNRLVPELGATGHEAIAVALPAGDDAAGWQEYASAVLRAIGDRPNVILVAHSLGGFTAPLVCERVPVDLLVLLNAMIPKPGETGNAWWSNTGQGAAATDYLASIGLSETDADDDNVTYFHDVPKDVVADYLSGPEPAQSMTPMTQPWPIDAWPDVPTRVLAGRDDRMFPATFQQRVARERLGIEADVMGGGHMVALSRPRELADRLEAYRRELGAAD